MNGAIIQGHTVELEKKLEETPEELLSLPWASCARASSATRGGDHRTFAPEVEWPGISFTVPKIGEALAQPVGEQRAELHPRKAFAGREAASREPHAAPDGADEKDLRFHRAAEAHRVFRQSQFQGAYPVAAMSVFRDGKPSKKDYRHFNIKTVEGPDDFASMEEGSTGGISGMLDEALPLPQLIVIDGGKGS